jgi:endonuclease/exonuclease/phosphatase family metal-dependent hydrolase
LIRLRLSSIAGIACLNKGGSMFGMTLRNCLMCLCGLAVCLPPFASSTYSAGDGDSGLRVMSFNLRNGNGNDAGDSWPNRRELVVSTIRAFNPDLLGTQETLAFQADYISAECPEYSKIGWPREQNPNGEQCTIFYRTDRFELMESGQFWLSETPEEKYSKSWDSSLPRVATWTILQDRNDRSSEFVFANTHFDHRGTKARLESAHLIHQRASELSGASVVLTGDFNCREGSEPWQALTASKLLRDTRRIRHPEVSEPEGTFNGFKGRADGGRIDWILATDHFGVKESDIDRTNKDGRYPSDHFPVTAVLKRCR